MVKVAPKVDKIEIQIDELLILDLHVVSSICSRSI